MADILSTALIQGDELPDLDIKPVTRLALALYCGASGDHNPIHVDTDFARDAGLSDVIAHGMLSMAYLGRLLTGWAPQSALRQFRVRFAAVTRVGDQITCSGRIIGREEHSGASCVRIELTARDQVGEVKLSGEAVLALPSP